MSTRTTTWHTVFNSYYTGVKWNVSPRVIENFLFELSGEVFPRVKKSFRQFKSFYQGQNWKVPPEKVKQFIDRFVEEITL